MKTYATLPETTEKTAWIRSFGRLTAVKLARLCHAAVLTESLDAKILFGRLVADEAELLYRATIRLAELSEGEQFYNSIANWLENQTIRVAVGCNAEGARALKNDEASKLGAPSTCAIMDEPTHRLYRFALDTKRRQDLDLARYVHLGGTGARTLSLAGVSREIENLQRPGREAEIKETSRATPVLSSRLKQTMALLHHSLTDIEIATLEMCCGLILEFPEMPIEFVRDVGRQCWDEARHAELFRTRLQALGGEVGDYPVTEELWRTLKQQPLEMRLAVHQCYGEWLGVDGAAWFRQDFMAHGDEVTAQIFDFVLSDEMGHVALGHRWIKYLCPTRQQRRALFSRAKAHLASLGRKVDGQLMFPIDTKRCRACKVEETEIEKLVRRYERHGSKRVLIL